MQLISILKKKYIVLPSFLSFFLSFQPCAELLCWNPVKGPLSKSVFFGEKMVESSYSGNTLSHAMFFHGKEKYRGKGTYDWLLLYLNTCSILLQPLSYIISIIEITFYYKFLFRKWGDFVIKVIHTYDEWIFFHSLHLH